MSAPAPASDTRVLVVDDEPVLAGMIKTYLERASFDATVTDNGLTAVELARELKPAVIVLDLGLPGLDGIEVCRQVRTFSDCYIVMCTARADEVDTLIGLSVGADDYIVKPFSVRELVARVQVMLRRPRGGAASVEPEHTVRTFGSLTIDPAGREVHLGGKLVELTRTEFDVLDTLSSKPRHALSRRQLINEVWGESWVGDEHLVDVHVAHLRKKLADEPNDPRFILTVRGVGYRMGAGK